MWWEGAGPKFFHADERGSVIALADSSGNLVGINSYDEYGIPGSANIGRFQYTGQMWLPEIGMQYSKARMYSPTLGRFMQTDPVGYDDGPNWYAYTRNDPVNGSDPSGLKGSGCLIVIGSRICGQYLSDDSSIAGSNASGTIASGTPGNGAYGYGAPAALTGSYVPGSTTVLNPGTSAEQIMITAGYWQPGVGGGFNNADFRSHNYPIGPYFLCVDSAACRSTIRTVFPYFIVPNLGSPVANGQISPVHVVEGGHVIGHVYTIVSPDGLSASNITLNDHILCCGQVDIWNFISNGSWFVQAHGYGSNYPVMGWVNQYLGSGFISGMLMDYAMVVRSRTH